MTQIRFLSYLCLSASICGQFPISFSALKGNERVFGTGRGIPSKTSSDLVHWTNAGAVFRSPPAWTQERGGAPELRHLFRGFGSNLWALLPIGVVLILGTTVAVLSTALVVKFQGARREI